MVRRKKSEKEDSELQLLPLSCTPGNSQKPVVQREPPNVCVDVIECLKNEILLLKEIVKGKDLLIEEKESLIQEKEKNIALLSKENEYLQQNYEFLLSNIVDKDSIMDNLAKLHDKIEMCKYSPKSTNENVKSYSDVMKNINSQKTPSQQIIKITPKCKQLRSKTKNDLETNVNISNLRVGVNSLKENSNGTVIIKCNRKEDVEKIQKAVKEKLPSQYNMEIIQLMKPKIKIPNLRVDKNFKKEQIEKMIIDQNPIINEDDYLYVKYVKDFQHKDTSTVFAEVNGSLFHKIMEQNDGKLFIGWQNLKVYENNILTQCTKCFRFRHTHNKCKNNILCPCCSEQHELKFCNNAGKPICNNCMFANSKYKTNHPINHFASDKKCPTYKYYQNQLKCQIDYEN